CKSGPLPKERGPDLTPSPDNPPRSGPTFPDSIAAFNGRNCVVDNAVVLTDAEGKPINSEKHQLAPGQDAKLVACRLVRGRRRSTGAVGFNDRIIYPKNFY